MPGWLATVVGVCAVLGFINSLLVLLIKLGFWGGSADEKIQELHERVAAMSDWRKFVESGALTTQVATHDREIDKLRSITHTLNNTAGALERLYKTLEEDIRELRAMLARRQH